MGRIRSINISEKKGTEKKEITSCKVTSEGLENDAHAGSWHRQVSILGAEAIDNFAKETGIDIAPGAFGENLVVEGIDMSKVSLLDRFIIGEVELEVTQIGKKCHGEACSIFKRTGECIMPKVGLFARVLKEGVIHKDQEVEIIFKNL